MAGPESFKRKSLVTTRDSPVVKCKRLWTESWEEKRDCMRKHG